MADYISQFTGGEIDRRLAKVSDLEAGKQDKLESGENIKTVGGQSLLGAGNIPLTDQEAVKFTPQTLTDEQKAQALANIGAASYEEVANMDFVTVTTLPEASADTMGHIYLVGPDANNNYDRYVTKRDGSTYTWEPLGSTQIDLSAYATKAEVEVLEGEVSGLSQDMTRKADIDGSYDGMAVGIARNLEGRTDVTDSFFERTTGGDAEVANGTAQLNEVKGKSQVWNQLLYPLVNSPITVAGVTYNYNGDGSITLNGTSTGFADNSLVRWRNTKVIAGHKYYFNSGSDKCYITRTNSSNFSPSVSEIVKAVALCTVGGSPYFRLSAIRYQTYVNETVWPIIIDLTLLGIDNLTTVEEVEAWLAENIGEQAYYPYNEGEVLNNRMTGVESIGFNLLDPATGKADIIGAYSDVYGNYYGITGTHGAMTFTDKFGNTETITPDEDGKFLLEKAGTLSVADAGEDCAVFLWWDGTQTEYKPYEKNVGALDVTHIYGKLNGEGEYVRVWPTGMPGIGDIKDSIKVVDGQVVAERKIGEVDLGTRDYNKTTSSGRVIFYTDLVGGSRIANPTGLCQKYPMSTSSTYSTDKVARIYGSVSYAFCRVAIRDSEYDNFNVSEVNAALSGVLIYYELATPQVYTDLIYRDSESFADGTPVTLPVNYKVDNWGIERIAPQNTEEAVVTTKPELTMRYSIDAVEELNTHRDEIDDLYEKNEELDERKPEKYGEYPDMAVGSAKTLAGNDTKVEDFFFKPIDCADGIAKLNSARGKSLVWNQMVQNGNFASTSKWAAVGSFSVANNIASLTPTTRYQGIYQSLEDELVSGHKYLVSGYLYQAEVAGAYIRGNFLGTNIVITLGDDNIGVWKRVAQIYIAGNSSETHGIGVGSTLSSDWKEIKARDIIVIDLTLMFGAGNEPATVAEFEAMFPLPYYDYNPGEIISNKTEEVKVVGFNQWDEEIEEGTIDASGNEVGGANSIRSKNYCPCFPNSDYFVLYPSSSANALYVCWYDASKIFINRASITRGGSVAVSPTNARYFRISEASYGPTYNHDICINISDPARNGEYEPYKTNTIELNLPTLTGKLNGEGESVVVFPDGLKSAGSVYDEIVGNKAIKRVGVVDMGGMSWVKSTDNRVDVGYYFNAADINSVSGNKLNRKSSKYAVSLYPSLSESISVYGSSMDKMVFCIASNNVAIIDSSYETAADLKAAMDGVLLYYELATSEEYILDAPLPDTFQAYKGVTIKQLPENTSEPVTAPMVMAVTYSLDAVGALVGLPRNYVSKESLQAMLNAMQSAGIIASYTMTYNENTGKYDFTFVAPTNS